MSSLKQRFHELVQVSRELSGDKPLPKLFQGVIDIVCKSTGADGGTLYMYDNKQHTLKAVLLTNISLGMNSVVEEFNPLAVSGFIEVPLGEGDGSQSSKISASSFLQNKVIAIDDVSHDSQFDFTGVRAFDKQNNYSTERIIAFPLNANNTMVGVMQVINPSHESFQKDYLEFLEILAGQIAIALNNAVLIRESENLLGAVVQMIGMAIDEKSPHTAGHCYRVTELTMMLADAVTNKTDGPFAHFALDEIQREELRMAALLHDVGKVITPDHILEKRTKLYSLTDRIEMLNERVHAWATSTELESLKKVVKDAGHDELIKSARKQIKTLPHDDIEFLDSVNKGLINMTDDTIEKLEDISHRTINRLQDKNKKRPVKEDMITQQDLANLRTFRGTLNPEERKIMEDHVKSSIRLLSSIPWPFKYSRLVEYAGHHHEKMDGTGYPNKVPGSEMSVPARILGIADRFEGMSAPDRPYRARKMTLGQVMKIMDNMSKDGEIDPDLYGVFRDSKIYLTYGRKYLDESLIDCD